MEKLDIFQKNYEIRNRSLQNLGYLNYLTVNSTHFSNLYLLHYFRREETFLINQMPHL